MANPARQSDYITEARQLAQQLWASINGLEALQREWNALNYTETLTEFTGANESLVVGDVSGVVFDTTNALTTLLGSGHATNIAKLL